MPTFTVKAKSNYPAFTMVTVASHTLTSYVWDLISVGYRAQTLLAMHTSMIMAHSGNGRIQPLKHVETIWLLRTASESGFASKCPSTAPQIQRAANLHACRVLIAVVLWRRHGKDLTALHRNGMLVHVSLTVCCLDGIKTSRDIRALSWHQLLIHS